LDYRQAAAVNARLELDLRIGAAFTRFQTLALQDRIPVVGEQNLVISYGTPLSDGGNDRILSISDVGIRGGKMAEGGEFRA
jgi:hypothetical protein